MLRISSALQQANTILSSPTLTKQSYDMQTHRSTPAAATYFISSHATMTDFETV